MRSLLKSFAFLATFILFMTMPLSAYDFEFHGYVDATFASDFSETFNGAEAKARFAPKLEFFGNGLYIMAAMELAYNALKPKEVDYKIGEVFLEYGWEWGDFRVGRQYITWGKADGLQLTDVFSSNDYTKFIGVEFKDARLPTNGIKLRHFGSVYTLELAYIPIYIPQTPDPRDNNALSDTLFPSQMERGENLVDVNYTLKESPFPRKFIDGEIGARASIFLPEIDFSFSCFRGWDHAPNFEMGVDVTPVALGNPAEVVLTPKSNRITMVGFDMAVPVSVFILKAEGAWLGKRLYAQKDPSLPLLPKHQLKLLFGMDCNPGKGWMLNFQYMEDVVFEETEKLMRNQRQPIFTFNISKKLLRDTLRLSGGIIVGCAVGDTRTSATISYDVIDNLTLSLGGVLYHSGKEPGQFGALEDLSHIWLRCRYSF